MSRGSLVASLTESPAAATTLAAAGHPRPDPLLGHAVRTTRFPSLRGRTG
ncbi:hypothetical protein [Streptomyces scabiei]|nr:hypothetical protein [Streptomyces scabiei]MDX3518927.1 hypothetical protein [Streptomyces scabiei]